MATSVGSIEYNARINTAQLKADAAVASKTVGSVGDASEASAAQGSAAFAKFAKGGVVAAIAAVGTLVFAIGKELPAAIGRIDTLVAFPKVMSAIGVSTEDSTASINKLSKELEGLPTPLNEGAKGVQRLVTSGLEINKATDAYLGLNNAIIAGGGNTAQAESMFLQLSQAISRGRMEGQEWNSIAANMPTVMQALQNETGKTKDELREMFMQDPQALIDNIIRLNKEGGGGLANLEEQARSASGGIQTSMDLVGTSIQRGIEDIVRELGNGDLEKGQEKIAAPFKSMADNIDTLFEKVSLFIKWWKDEFWPSIEPTIIALRDTFEPLLSGIKNEFTILIDEVKRFVTENQPFIDSIKMVAGLLGAILLGAIVVVGFAILGLIEVFRFIVNVAEMLWNAIGTVIDWFKRMYEQGKENIETLKTAFSDMWETIKEVFNNILEGARNTWNDIWSAITGVAERIVSFFSGAWQWLVDAGKSIVGGLVDGIKNMGGAVWDAISGAAAKIGEFFSGAASWLFDSGKAIIEGLISGIKSMAGGVKGAVEEVLKKARDLLPFSPAKEGPFSGKGWTLYSGMSIMDGLAEGIKKNSLMPNLALENALSNVAVSANANISTADSVGSSTGPSPVNINLNMSGIMSRSAADERDIARNLIKRLNQELTAKGQPAIGGIV